VAVEMVNRITYDELIEFGWLVALMAAFLLKSSEFILQVFAFVFDVAPLQLITE
jgi:hypothetical protein